MILGLEIFMFVTGLTALVIGRFPVGRDRFAQGIGARVAGVVLMLPVPLGLIIAVAWKGSGALEMATDGGRWKLIGLEVGLVVACGVVGYLIAALSWDPFVDSKRRRRKRASRIRREDGSQGRPLRAMGVPRDDSDEDSDDDIPVRRRSAPGLNPWIFVGIGAGVLSIVLLMIGFAVVLSRDNSVPAPNVIPDAVPPARPLPGDIARNNPPAVKALLREFSAPDGSFKVQVPGTPQQSVQQANGNVVHVFVLDHQQARYTITFVDLNVPAGVPMAPLEQLLDVAAEGFRRKPGLTVTRESRSFVAGLYSARDLEGTAANPPGSAFRYRVTIVGRRLFHLGITGVPAEVYSATANQFLQSLVPRPAPPVAVRPPQPLPINPLQPKVPAPADAWQPLPPLLVKNPLSPAKLPGLIAYWPFEEAAGNQAADASGNGLTARASGTQRIKGVLGTALLFDGKSDYLDLGTSPRLNFGAGAPVTLAGWVATPADGVFCSFRNSQREATAIDLSVKAGRLRVELRDDDTRVVGLRMSAGKVRDGRWHHFGLVRQADSTVVLYLDGVVQARARSGRVVGAITTDLRALGAERYQVMHPTPGKQPYFQGAVDEFCIFGRDLSVAEVAALAGKMN